MCEDRTWLHLLFTEIIIEEGIEGEPNLAPTIIHSENTAVISLQKEEQVSERNKLIEIKVHHVLDLQRNKIIGTAHILTKHKLAETLSMTPLAMQLNYLINYFMTYKLKNATLVLNILWLAILSVILFNTL